MAQALGEIEHLRNVLRNAQDQLRDERDKRANLKDLMEPRAPDAQDQARLEVKI